MTRKQERKRRLACWLASVAVGAAAAWASITLLSSAALAALCLAAGALVGHRFMKSPVGVPILTYHSVSPDPAWLPWSKEISVHPDTFARHLDQLAAMGVETIGTRDYLADPDGARSRGAVVLHFDDGYLDNWYFAVPALQARGMAGTFFPSLDFVEPGDRVRAAGPDASGYMNWAELRAVEAIPGLEVEPHGIDHGRVAISPKVVSHVSPDNWRPLAWVQWAAQPGPKHAWFRTAEPVAAGYGSPVYESEGALAARAWSGEGLEPVPAYHERVRGQLERCVERFEEELGRRPQIFCWPENRTSPDARAISAEVGFLATTAGKQRNAQGEPLHILSRTHVGDRALGFRFGLAEALHFRATVRLFQGNHYWYLVVAPMDLLRKLVMRLRDRFGRPYS
jgi:peptidoglycan/xylan/chitin deacetylase (PgdA/CDA1 family)